MGNGGLSKARLARMHDIMAGHVNHGDLPGLVTVVHRRDETQIDAIGEMAFGDTAPMQRDTLFRLASLTKPITAAAALILIEDCKIRLDEPVDRLLPELADRRVLKRLDGPLTDTVPADRPISVRDLLTFRLGFGAIFARPNTYPIQQAISDAGLAPSPNVPAMTPEEWLRRLGSLPLLHQPGEGWMYHTGSDALGVLIARAAGQTLEAFLQERLFEPLGMKDTTFQVPAHKLDRLPPTYTLRSETGELVVHDDPTDSQWSRTGSFPSGGGGLVSTAEDYLAFCRMLLNQGRHGRERILSRPSVELMTTDHLTPEDKAANHIFFGDSWGWGFGLAIQTRRDDLPATPGRFGWTGGTGTSAYTDPAEDMIGILLTQRLMMSPQPPAVFTDFWTAAYAAIDD